MRLSKITLALAATLGVAACGAMPLSSMLRMRHMDFLTTDVSALRAGVGLPAGVQPVAGTPRLVMLVVHQTAKGEPLSDEREFPLHWINDPAELAALRREAGGNGPLWTYRLAPDDAAALTRFRDEQLNRKDRRSGQSTISIGVAADACYTGTKPPTGPIPVSTYLRGAETDGYVTMIKDYDLNRIAQDYGADKAPKLTACGKAS